MYRVVHAFVLVTLAVSLIIPAPVLAGPAAQTPVPRNPEVARILAGLTPEERVGQLFIVTFSGTAVDETTPIHELVSQYHIGGVVLSAANNNFVDVDRFAAGALELTAALQRTATVGTDAASEATPGAPGRQYLPLFIALSYADDASSGETLMPGPSGLTHLPSAMTLGAAWDRPRAQAVGQIAGLELSALGINMLFGPSLDVVESPQPASPADFGSRAFGGDPYWVGVIGQSFIQGLHEVSGGRIAVVSQHFPGCGACDRILDDQVPTVYRLLDELKAIDLAPFFRVAQGDPAGTTDALLVSHIRYRGLQGNIRDTTRPISFDQQALGDLLGLPELAAWRANGGVTVSDSLGVRAVRRFYDPTERTFPAFRIALDAFLAGNDVLYLGQFGSPGTDPINNIKSVLTQFVQKYREDPAFALRVDEAVTRIIGLKLRLYGEFSPEAVQPTADLDQLGRGSLEALAVTRDAATLISPTAAELANRVPSPPSLNQRIVFFTDSRTIRQCNTCVPRPAIAADALQQAIFRLYGRPGTGEIADSNLSSFSFVDLTDFLDNKPAPPTSTPLPTPVEAATAEGGSLTPTPTSARPGLGEAIRSADWVVFGMLDIKQTMPPTLALRRLLAERPDLLRDKRVIVFAFDAPYYLDPSEVAQLTAYYALYNRTSAAVEVAARVLFQEITPTGTSPVSIDSIGYRLIEVTQPDPDQVIELTYGLPATEGATPTPAESTPAPLAGVALNDTVNFHTSVIHDRNGHPVPDGTPVKFWVNYSSERRKVLFAEPTTVDGVASASLLLDTIGALEVSVTSEPAIGEGFKLKFDVGPDPRTPEPITATPGPTDTPSPTVLPTDTPAPVITPTPEQPPPVKPPVTWADLLMTALTLAVMGAAAWRVTHSRVDAVSDGVKLILIIAIGAFLGYDYYALKLPGAALVSGLGMWAVPLMVWAGGLIGFGLGWLWLRKNQTPDSNP